MKLNGCWRKKQFRNKIWLSCGKRISLISPFYINFKQVRGCSDFEKWVSIWKSSSSASHRSEGKVTLVCFTVKEQEAEMTCSKFHKNDWQHWPCSLDPFCVPSGDLLMSFWVLTAHRKVSGGGVQTEIIKWCKIFTLSPCEICMHKILVKIGEMENPKSTWIYMPGYIKSFMCFEKERERENIKNLVKRKIGRKRQKGRI